jgi:small conductance mechanosensitive channel
MEVSMENWIQPVKDFAALYGLKILGALLILIIGRFLVGIIAGMIRRVMRKREADPTLTGFVHSFVKYALLTFVIISALSAVGIPMTSFIAIVGAAGLAIGFALQGSLANFAAGIMLIIFRPFKAGDFVEAGGSTGSVENIGIFNTTLKTPDNKEVIIPNGGITGNNITNYSAKDTRRVDMVFGIGYDDDIKLTKDTLWELLRSDQRVLKDPEPTVAVSELGDSSVNFVVRPWVKSADYWGVFFDFHEKVKLTFDQKGISIPYPQQDVHMHQVESKVA